MASRVVLGTKYPSETLGLVFDFASRLLVGQTLVSSSAVAAVYSGTDPSPPTLTTVLSGTKVTVGFAGGLTGVTYIITCTASTAGQLFNMEGYLVVIPNTQ